MKNLISLAFLSFLIAPSSFASTIYENVQCWAHGHTFRTGGADPKDMLTFSRFAFRLESEDGTIVTAKGYLGHIAMALSEDGKTSFDLADKYAVYSGENMQSSLSPKATKYTDKEYFRFKELRPTAYTAGEADFSGYFVISKKALEQGFKGEFDAHFVHQAGDHHGGTLDYVCKAY